MRLFTCGNPLLDISREVEDTFMKKYKLTKGGFGFYNPEVHQGVFEELLNDPEHDVIPGGSALNSTRICRQLMTEEGLTGDVAYTGCIGKDQYSEVLTSLCKDLNIRTMFAVDPKEPTGVCAVAVFQKERCLTTRLGAANLYPKDTLISLLEEAKAADVCFTTGYFLAVCPEGVLEVGSVAKIFMISLSAPFIIDMQRDALLEALEYADYVFSNQEEWSVFATVQNLPSDGSPTELADIVHGFIRRLSRRPHVTTVMTCGPGDVVVSMDGTTRSFPVEHVPPEDIVDSNGVGDAFVGGYIAGVLVQGDVDECVRRAGGAASRAIRNRGCIL